MNLLQLVENLLSIARVGSSEGLNIARCRLKQSLDVASGDVRQGMETTNVAIGLSRDFGNELLVSIDLIVERI